MLRQTQGPVVVWCCWKQLCSGCCVCPVCGQMTEVTLRAAPGVWRVSSRAQVRLGGDRCHLWLPEAPRDSEQGTQLQLLPLRSAVWGRSSCRSLMGTPEWGVTGYHRNSAAECSSSCWICLTWVYAVPFYSRVNICHPQPCMVTSSIV